MKCADAENRLSGLGEAAGLVAARRIIFAVIFAVIFAPSQPLQLLTFPERVLNGPAGGAEAPCGAALLCPLYRAASAKSDGSMGTRPIGKRTAASLTSYS